MTRLLFFCLVFLAPNAFSQECPARPVKFIVPQAPGPSPDITARLIADRLAQLWGQQVVVENRPGGQNVPGAQAAARAPADG
jgi:tripartite-type tricarboxylate transporter receptor subunit TctC